MKLSRRNLIAAGVAAAASPAIAAAAGRGSSNAARFSLGYAPHEGSFASRGGLLEQIARHHPGPVRFDRAALADIRVSGVLPLDDTAQTLRLLQRSFPQLRMRFLASRWVWVDLQAVGS